MTDKNTINSSMLDILNIEISTQTKKILDTLSLMGSTDELSTHYESIINHTRAIKSAINLVNVNVLKPIIENLENSLSYLQSINFIIDENTKNTFIETTDTLVNISTHDTSALESPTDKTLNTIELINEKLKNIENEITESPITALTDTSEKTPSNKPLFSTADNIDSDMFILFCTELKNSIESINNHLFELSDDDEKALESMMRAAHSIKGAARMIGIDAVVKLSHSMEDIFVAAQNKNLILNTKSIDQIFICNDILLEIESISVNEVSNWSNKHAPTIAKLINTLENILSGEDIEVFKPDSQIDIKQADTTTDTGTNDSMVKVSTNRINKLVSLSGELLVSTNWVEEHARSLKNLKRKHNEIHKLLYELQNLTNTLNHSEEEKKLILDIQNKSENLRDSLSDQLTNVDNFERRSTSINSQINHEIIASRMRPFKDNTQGYKRMVRDISNSLNKKVKLEIEGLDTPVDRDILEKLDAPLNHMIRNSIDHGIEMPEERIQLGKPEFGTILIRASHQSGRLKIQIKDDGKGINIEEIRDKVLHKKLVNKSMAENLSKSELLDFIFLPAFSTRSEVTELSGRGVGLDIVHSALQEIRGKLHADTELGKGMEINMELPLTLSVIRSLIVSLNNELYAFPLAKIQSLISVDKEDISVFEDKQYISIEDKHIGLIHCSQILGIKHIPPTTNKIPIIIIGDWNVSYGIVVDELIGEKKLALRQLNKKLGKIKDISAAAITDDGDPVLILDVDDLQQSIIDIINGKDIYKVGYNSQLNPVKVKRVLVVDDSLTVREIEKKLLEAKGYSVDIAIDGVDGWNTVRNVKYDLIISDIDMPRMNGIELITMIKNDSTLRNIPVMMVSYKDRDEDRQKGLEAGADYYLTKGSFHDDTLIDAVIDLIGEAQDIQAE